MNWLSSLISLATLFMAAPAAHAQGDLKVEGDWTHPGTGFVFPERVGGAVRTRVHTYDAEGLDASAGYFIKRRNDVAFFTVYVYPVRQGMDCAATFEDMSRGVDQSYSDVQRGAVDRWTSPSGRTPDAAYHTSFQFIGELEGKQRPLHSESYLFCPAGGNWLVAARASWAQEGADFEDAFADFLHAFSWPDALDAPSQPLATAPRVETSTN
ncbi:hypothetical protein ACX40Y_12305 [Sphingomonas sp. RS6]